MLVFFSALTGLAALDNWFSVARGRLAMEKVTKVLTMLALIGAVVCAGDVHRGTTWLLVAALALGLVGDILLLGDPSLSRFLGGVAAFLVGHLAYLLCFVRLGLPAPGWAWISVAALVAVLLATRDLLPAAWRRGGLGAAAPLASYSLVIGAMLVCAWCTGHPLIAAGALVFVLSDALIALYIARHDFASPHGWYHVAIMVSYHVGQALIALGVLRALA